MKYGFIYETTCLVNGKKYIGQHKRIQDPDNPDDTWYLGSGTYLKRAINRYGEGNFVRVILEDCETAEELDDREKYYLTLYRCATNPLYYNVESEPWKSNYSHSEETKRKISLAAKNRPSKPLSEEHKAKISESNKGKHSDVMIGRVHINNGTTEKVVDPASISEYLDSGWTRGRLPENKITNPSFIGYWEGKSQSEECKRSRSESMRGKVWVHRGEELLRVDSSEVDSYLSRGYSQGVTGKFRELRSKDVKNKIHVHRGDSHRFIYPNELDEYISDGWQRGLPPSHKSNISNSKLGKNNPMYGKSRTNEEKAKISETMRTKVWVCSSTEKKFIPKDELEIYLSKGYRRGMKW